MAIERSNATHASTFEWTKCRRGPRTSQMPSSGSFHFASSDSQERELQRPRVFVDREAGARALPHDVGELAVHVELELFVRGVADPHRRRVAPARQPIEGQLGEASFAGDAVHDL